ncbi:MAG TPA: efflux RND transporter periplasmic adaptor subunit [Blastocatellia bacterium]|nr:efflux RND transporter periplasmic adaptor subunit [Blastocatellia bacterium]
MSTAPSQNDSYCLYPPRVADEVDVTEQVEDGLTRYVVRNTRTSRYFLLKTAEYQVFRRIDGAHSLNEISRGGRDSSGPRVSRAALVKFLSRLESLGLLAAGGADAAQDSTGQERGLYFRVRLFNPDRFLSWLDRSFGWALTRPFIVASFVMMAVAVIGLLVRADEVASYTAYAYQEYGLVVIMLVALTITASHEFAHGLACKHFGGDVKEVGLLMIYYVLPALYCNVSDIYRIGRKSERLWVIGAGIYWQLGVSAVAALIWLAATPFTPLADLTFLIFIGGTLNVLFNCNPLIKLDGYYAFSQIVGVPNLQARSSQYVGRVAARLLGEGDGRKDKFNRPALLIGYWLCSIVYSVGLIWFILAWMGNWLIDGLGLFGVLLTLLLAALLTERWWKPLFKGATTMSAQKPALETKPEQSAEAAPRKRWFTNRRRVVKWGLAVLIVAALVAPWEASTGSDCALTLPPGREEVARANTDAVLREILVRPGDAVAEGAKLAHLANPEIEDRLTQLNSEIEQLHSRSSRIEEELRVRSELLLSANFKEVDRKRIVSELKEESSHITGWGSQQAASSPLPASLAVLQSEIELKQTAVEHNRREVERYKKLLEQGLVGSQLYDRAVAEMRMSEKELQGARSRLEAAIVEHRRVTSGAETNSLVAETEARAARSNFDALIAELHANRQQMESLRQRREILQREYDGMNVLAPKAGVILGDDLHKMVGRRYTRGEEICRIGELEQFLLRIDVSEREIADVRLDSPVRFKLKTIPGRTFTGRVSKINAEPVTDARGQQFYPVEVMVENSDGLLRPGMTGFARISFGNQAIGMILAQKLWHSLRPELWLF